MKTAIHTLAASPAAKIVILMLIATAVAMIIATLILAFGFNFLAYVTGITQTAKIILIGEDGDLLSTYITGITAIGVSTIVAVAMACREVRKSSEDTKRLVRNEKAKWLSRTRT